MVSNEILSSPEPYTYTNSVQKEDSNISMPSAQSRAVTSHVVTERCVCVFCPRCMNSLMIKFQIPCFSHLPPRFIQSFHIRAVQLLYPLYYGWWLGSGAPRGRRLQAPLPRGCRIFPYPFWRREFGASGAHFLVTFDGVLRQH
jgi:hypothetical protein